MQDACMRRIQTRRLLQTSSKWRPPHRRPLRLSAAFSSSPSPDPSWRPSAGPEHTIIDVLATEVVQGSRAGVESSAAQPAPHAARNFSPVQAAVDDAAQPSSSVQAAVDHEAETSSTSQAAVTAAAAAQPDMELWQKEQRRAEAMRRLLATRLRQLRSGRWLSPPSPHGPEDSMGSDGSQPSNAGVNSELSLAVRSPWMTYLLACTATFVFVRQWWPLLPLLLERAQLLDLAPLAALALAVPDTPVTSRWQLDVVAVATGGSWSSLWTSCFVHSGLLPAALCLSSFVESGVALERAYGWLVLLLHVGLCGVGAALAQMKLQQLIFGIAGPGVAAGLVVALLVHQARLADQVRLTPLSACVLGLTPLLALCQPLLGVWGLLGACVGGALAALCCFALLNALRYCLFSSLFLAVCVLELAFNVVVAVPRAIAVCVGGVVRVTCQVLGVVASTIREMK